MTIATIGRRMKKADMSGRSLMSCSGCGDVRPGAPGGVRRPRVSCARRASTTSRRRRPSACLRPPRVRLRSRPSSIMRTPLTLGPTSHPPQLHLVVGADHRRASTCPAPRSTPSLGSTSTLWPASGRRMRTRPYWPGRRQLSGLGNSACSCIVPVLGSICRLDRDDDALVRIDAAIGQHELEPGVAVLGVLALLQVSNCFLAQPKSRPSSCLSARAPHVVDLAHREVHADGIDLRHGGEQGRAVLPDQVADAHARQPGDAVDRRADLGVREVQRRPAPAAPRAACTWSSASALPRRRCRSLAATTLPS